MRRAVVALVLVLLLTGAKGPPDVAKAPVAALAEHPGRLRNAAQQALYRRDVPGATAIMARVLAVEPTDGFTHGLLAQSLVYGWDLGVEAPAAWAAMAALAPDRPELIGLAALAEKEAHQDDRFLGPDSAWFAASLDRIEAALRRADPAARYELLLAKRTLLSLVKQHDAAREAGLAAHALRPDALQGRLSAMIQARIDGDLRAAADQCLAILQTEPWAAEACSTLWGASFPDDPVAAETLKAVQGEILARIAALEDRWVGDPVVANELLKFRARVRDPEGQAAYRARVEAASPGYRYLNRSRWWREGVVVAEPFRAMNVAATKTRDLPPADRLAALMAFWGGVPAAGADDWGLNRYLVAVADAARESGDRAAEQRALEARVEGQPRAPDALLALARFHAAEPGGREEALELVRRSAEALLGEPWDPMAAATRRQRFSDHVAALREGLEERRTLEGSLGEPTIDPSVIPSTVSGWLTWADAATDPVLALHGGLEGLSLLPPADLARLSAPILDTTLRRFRAALPAIDALGVDARTVLLEAVIARATDRARRREDDGREQHPFVGQPAPDFALTTLGGRTLTNTNQRGRVVVVDFWATWCGPCVQELPQLDALKERLGDAPVTFLLASVDEDEAPVAPFLAGRGLDLDSAWIGNAGMMQRWQVRGIPSLFVVDAAGIVRHHHQGYRPDIGEVLDEQIRGLLADSAP